MGGYPRAALVVEPNEAARADLYRVLEALSIRSSAVATAQQAMQSLPLGFELLFVSAELTEGTVELVDVALSLRAPPTIFVTGSVPDPRCLFELAKAGAHIYLPPPVSVAGVHAGLRAFDVSAHLLRLVRPLVGHLGLKEIQACVRRALLLEALARSNGSRRSAAQLLGVTRPAIQKWLRGLAAEKLALSKD